MTNVVILGGGPGGYEAALMAAQQGANTTIVEHQGLGGSAVLTDCVPSKTLIATSEVMTMAGESGALGVRIAGEDVHQRSFGVNISAVDERVIKLAVAQSTDITQVLAKSGVRIVRGTGRLLSDRLIEVSPSRFSGPMQQLGELPGVEVAHETIHLEADVILLATGNSPRELPDAMPDGHRILKWTQLYHLTEFPEKLLVVGSGVTGAEFAAAYHALGSEVTLISSREQVLPGEDPDAARVLEETLRRRGMRVLSRSRAEKVQPTEDGVVATLTNGTQVHGSHALIAVGSIPNTARLNLSAAGVLTDERGFIQVDQVSRTSARNIYAAGDCTGVYMLASVAAMQGRIAMSHALGMAVTPLDLSVVANNIFTTPEIATVGVTQQEVDAGSVDAVSVLLPLHTNARAKMQGLSEGFVKLFAYRNSMEIIGGVVVAPRASELIYPITIAIAQRLSAQQLARTFTVYPSMTGSIAEAARQLALPR